MKPHPAQWTVMAKAAEGRPARPHRRKKVIPPLILVGLMAGKGSIEAQQTINFTSPGQTRSATIQLNSTNNPTTLNVTVPSATQSGIISESGVAGSIIKTGSGTLVLSGANTYTGATIINAGALSVSSLAATVSSGIGLSPTTATNLILNGGGLTYTGGSITTSRLFSVGTNGGTITSSGTAAINFNGGTEMGYNDQTGARTLTLNGSQTGNNTLNVIVGDNGGATSLTKSGSGTWILKGKNTYTGTTGISAGTLQLGLPDIIGNSSALVIDSSGTFDMKSFAETVGSLAGSGAVVGMGTFTVGGDNTSTTFSGTLASTGSLIKAGTGTLVLSGSSTYTGGTTISGGGTLSVAVLAAGGTTSSIGQSDNSAAKLTINGGTLKYTGGAASTDRLFTIGANGATLDASGTGAIDFTATGTEARTGADNSRILTLTGTNTDANTLEAVIADSPSGLGLTSLGKSGAGRWVLGGVNTYTGNTTISGGTLALSASGSISASPVVTVGTIGSTDAVLDVTAKPSFNIGAGQTLAGIGTVNLGAGKTVTIDGHLSPGISLGTNTITGNLALGGGATSDFQLGAPGTQANPGFSDSTQVSGSLSLGGTLNVTNDANASGRGSVGAGSYQIFTQTGTATGSFVTVNAIGTGAGTLHPVVNTSTDGRVYLDVYRLASGTAIPSSQFLGNVRTSASEITGGLAVSNLAATDGYSEDLGVSTGGTTANVRPGAASMVHFTLPTGGVAGAKSGSSSVTLTSAGVGTFGATPLSSNTVTLAGNAYDYANPTPVTSSPIAFGAVHQGATATGAVSIANTTISNVAYQDSLDATATTTNAHVSGDSVHILAGTSRSLTLTANTSTAGSLASTVNLGYVSNANGVAGLTDTVLTSGTLITTGVVYSGQSVWSTNGSGSWGQLTGAGGDSFGGNWGANQGSPGLDAGFTNTDTATFDNTVLSAGNSAVISLNGANPSLSAITFNTSGGGYTLAQGSGGSITLNGGSGSTLITVGSGTHVISAPLVGSGGLTKAGAGTLTLSGLNTYTGATTILDGRLVLNGATAGDVAVQSGAEFTGRATVNGTLGGAGAIGPGNSPGILTAGAVDPTGGLSFNFEFTLAGVPTWSNAANSGNDVLHLNLGLSAPLTAANVVNLYFASADISYTGGFFVNGETDELSADLAHGTFRYFVLDEETGTVLYNGHRYRTATGDVSVSSTKINGADFTDGSVDGWSQTYELHSQVVPEPGTWAMLIGGVLLLLGFQSCRVRK